MKTDGQKPHEKSQEKRTHQPIPLVSDSQTHSSFQSQQKQPQVLSQQLPFIFQSSQAKEESVNKHTSVIQSTGLVPNVKPLSLVHQAKKETYLKLIVPSPDLLKAGNKNTSEESVSLTSDVRLKRVSERSLFVVMCNLRCLLSTVQRCAVRLFCVQCSTTCLFTVVACFCMCF